MGVMTQPVVLMDAAHRGMRVHRFTVVEYDQMIATGLLPESTEFELIDGLITRKDRSDYGGDPMSKGVGHSHSVRKLVRMSGAFEPYRFFVDSQEPLQLSEESLPEPDAAVVHGHPDMYADRRPVANDVACVIEVSDSSLNYDRTIKFQLYQAAGIRQYIIVNLQDQVVESYRMDDSGLYGPPTIVSRGGAVVVDLESGRSVPLSVDEILPPKQ